MKSASVFVVGTRLWSKRLADQLALSNQFATVESYDLSLKSVYKLFWLLKFKYIVRVGVRPGVPRPRGFLMDAYCYLASLLGVKVVMYWIGSDVLRTLEADKTANTKYFRFWLDKTADYFHAAGAPWLSDELKTLGVEVETLYFPSPLSVPEHIPPLPDKFSVLSYVPDARHDFYGSSLLYECAKKNPDIQFDIFAGRGTWLTQPLENLKCHGWVDDPESLYASCVVVLRLVTHDALGATVREGWINGRYVIYTYDIDNVIYFDGNDGEALSAILRDLKDRFDSGSLAVNKTGYDFASQNFNAETLTERFIEKCLPDR